MTGAARRAVVVTGGGRGIGRAITEAQLATGGSVVVVERDPDAVRWVEHHPAGPRLVAVIGSAAEEGVAEEAANVLSGEPLVEVRRP